MPWVDTPGANAPDRRFMLSLSRRAPSRITFHRKIPKITLGRIPGSTAARIPGAPQPVPGYRGLSREHHDPPRDHRSLPLVTYFIPSLFPVLVMFAASFRQG